MSKTNNAYDFLAKILIIGDSGVGKTCLLLRFCENSFTTSHLATIGIDFKMKTIEVDGKKIKIQIWDTAGQERYKTITQTYYKGAMGIILSYAVNDAESFNNIENWMKQIKQHASEDVCKILIGNKCDMPDRVIPYEDGKKLADQYGIHFFETSAKENLNVQEAFKSIAKEVKDKLADKQGVPTPNAGNGAGKAEGTKLTSSSKSEAGKGKCC